MGVFLPVRARSLNFSVSGKMRHFYSEEATPGLGHRPVSPETARRGLVLPESAARGRCARPEFAKLWLHEAWPGAGATPACPLCSAAEHTVPHPPACGLEGITHVSISVTFASLRVWGRLGNPPSCLESSHQSAFCSSHPDPESAGTPEWGALGGARSPILMAQGDSLALGTGAQHNEHSTPPCLARPPAPSIRTLCSEHLQRAALRLSSASVSSDEVVSRTQ